jgi:hypothetical protein
MCNTWAEAIAATVGHAAPQARARDPDRSAVFGSAMYHGRHAPDAFLSV